jgi:hypothetical protein
VEQPVDVAGVEGVAAAAAVHELDRVRPRPQPHALADDHRPIAAEGDDGGSGAHAAERLGLAQRVALAGDQLGLVVVRQEDIDVRQQAVEAAEVVGRPRRHHVEDGPRAGPARRGEHGNQLVLAQLVHEEVAAEVQHLAALDPFEGNVGGAEGGVGAEGVDEAAVLAGHVDNEGLAGVQSGRKAQRRHVEAVAAQHVGDDAAGGVLADAADHRRRHAHLGQIDRDVGRTAADG